MLADLPSRDRAGGFGCRLAGRLLLPVPSIEIRSCRPRLQGRAGTDQSDRSTAQVRLRHAHRDRRRHQGLTGQSRQNEKSHRRFIETHPGQSHNMQRILSWIDDRFPLTKLWNEQWGKYVAPKNFNFWYYFGSLAAFVLVLQIVTGIFLAMSYKP